MKTTKAERADRLRRDGFYNRASKPENQFVYRLIADVEDAVRLLEKEHLERLGLCWPADDCRACHEHRHDCAEQQLDGVCRFLKEPKQ